MSIEISEYCGLYSKTSAMKAYKEATGLKLAPHFIPLFFSNDGGVYILKVDLELLAEEYRKKSFYDIMNHYLVMKNLFSFNPTAGRAFLREVVTPTALECIKAAQEAERMSLRSIPENKKSGGCVGKDPYRVRYS